MSSGSGDGTIRFWDVRTGDEMDTVAGHTDYVYSVVFNPNGKFFASGYADGSIRFWDAETGRHLKTLKKGYEASGLVFSEDGKTLAYADGLDIRLQDVGTGEEKMRLTGHTLGMHSMALSPDGDTLASGSEDMTIRLWDMHTGEHKKKKHSTDIHTESIVSPLVLMVKPSQVAVRTIRYVYGTLTLARPRGYLPDMPVSLMSITVTPVLKVSRALRLVPMAKPSQVAVVIMLFIYGM